MCLARAGRRGLARVEVGDGRLSHGSRQQPIQFTGEERDKATGFVYLRSRMYAPDLGWFLQRDAFPGRVGNRTR